MQQLRLETVRARFGGSSSGSGSGSGSDESAGEGAGEGRVAGCGRGQGCRGQPRACSAASSSKPSAALSAVPQSVVKLLRCATHSSRNACA